MATSRTGLLALAMLSGASAFGPRVYGVAFRGSALARRSGALRQAAAGVSPFAQSSNPFNPTDPSAFTACVLGDLHLDPRYMDDVFAGREHFKSIIADANAKGIPTAVCSLGKAYLYILQPGREYSGA